MGSLIICKRLTEIGDSPFFRVKTYIKGKNLWTMDHSQRLAYGNISGLVISYHKQNFFVINLHGLHGLKTKEEEI
jgi:hypothetical protein